MCVSMCACVSILYICVCGELERVGGGKAQGREFGERKCVVES